MKRYIEKPPIYNEHVENRLLVRTEEYWKQLWTAKSTPNTFSSISSNLAKATIEVHFTMPSFGELIRIPYSCCFIFWIVV